MNAIIVSLALVVKIRAAHWWRARKLGKQSKYATCTRELEELQDFICEPRILNREIAVIYNDWITLTRKSLVCTRCEHYAKMLAVMREHRPELATRAEEFTAHEQLMQEIGDVTFVLIGPQPNS